MVVHNLDVFSARGGPAEAETILVVDTDAMLTGAVALEGLESVARRHAKVVEPPRDLQLPKLASCDGLDASKPLDPPPMRDALGDSVPERHDHDGIVTRRVINVKRDYRGGLSSGPADGALNAQYRVERIEEGGLRDGAVLTMFRRRPVMPGLRK